MLQYVRNPYILQGGRRVSILEQVDIQLLGVLLKFSESLQKGVRHVENR